MNAQELCPAIAWDRFDDPEAFVMLMYESVYVPGTWGQDGCHDIDSDLSQTIQILNHASRYEKFWILAVWPSHKWTSFVRIEDSVIQKVLHSSRGYDPMLADMMRNRGPFTTSATKEADSLPNPEARSETI